MNNRSRMIVDLPRDVQMSIRLRAVKNGWTTGEVVACAIKQAFPDDIIEARKHCRDRAAIAKAKA